MKTNNSLLIPNGLLIIIPTLVLLQLCSCLSPVNTVFESSRTLGKSNMEIVANYCRNSANFDGETKHLSDNFGFRLGYGVSDKFDAKLRYERISSENGEGGINYLEFIPKFSFVKNIFSAMLPLGMYFSEGESSFVLSPRLIVSYPASNKFEISFSTKSDIYLEDNSEVLIGFNIGAGISKDLNKWAIRPELGLMINPGEEGSIFTYGLGFNYNFSTMKN